MRNFSSSSLLTYEEVFDIFHKPGLEVNAVDSLAREGSRVYPLGEPSVRRRVFLLGDGKEGFEEQVH